LRRTFENNNMKSLLAYTGEMSSKICNLLLRTWSVFPRLLTYLCKTNKHIELLNTHYTLWSSTSSLSVLSNMVDLLPNTKTRHGNALVAHRLDKYLSICVDNMFWNNTYKSINNASNGSSSKIHNVHIT